MSYMTLPVFRAGRVVAYAKIDEEDFAELSKHNWGLAKNGYVRRGGSEKVLVYLHRQIMKAQGRDQPVDHINHDKLDNRRSNLRVCTRSENLRNRKKPPVNSTSGIIGVTWSKHYRKWCAQIAVNRKKYNLGRFDSKEEAAKARDLAAQRLHGEFATLSTSYRSDQEVANAA
jgi:hypothetical protein